MSPRPGTDRSVKFTWRRLKAPMSVYLSSAPFDAAVSAAMGASHVRESHAPGLSAVKRVGVSGSAASCVDIMSSSEWNAARSTYCQ